MKFLDPPEQYQAENSTFHVIPCPYEGKTTYGDGAKHGAQAIIDASQHLEYYDLSTQEEPYRHGIHTRPSVKAHDDINQASTATEHSQTLPVFLGGDHSITIPITTGLPRDVDVLILDAHADMRYKWKRSEHNHACVTRHVSADRRVSVLGARSMDRDEHRAANEAENVDLVTPHDANEYNLDWLNDRIHISIDVDAFDPSIISQTGTPEPNGLSYDDVTDILTEAFTEHDVVSVDIVEFAPSNNEPATKRAEAYTLARLAYHVMGLAAKTQKHRGLFKDHGQ